MSKRSNEAKEALSVIRDKLVSINPKVSIDDLMVNIDNKNWSDTDIVKFKNSLVNEDEFFELDADGDVCVTIMLGRSNDIAIGRSNDKVICA